MLKRFCLFSCLLSAALSVKVAHAEDMKPLNFATFQIPHYVENENFGVFIDLTREIAERANLKIKITIYPRLRAFHFFSAQQADVLFPVVEVDLQGMQSTPSLSDSFYAKVDYIFTLNDTPFLSSIEDLHGISSVGIIRGYPYSPKIMFSEDLKLMRTANMNQLLKMLLGRRVGAAVIEGVSARHAIDILGVGDKIHYSKQTPISTMHTYYALANTLEGVETSKRISAAIADMKRDGSYMRILQNSIHPLPTPATEQ